MALPTNQRMFHGGIRAAALADQLCARFNDRQHRTHVQKDGETALVQIGSRHGTPVTVHIADTDGGVLVTMSRDRDWLDRLADTGDMVERAAGSPLSFLTLIPDIIGEARQVNITSRIWDAINDICVLTRSLAGEDKAPLNPKICPFCGTANHPEFELCQACGASLPSDLPRICPKCGRGHTSDALFCQACGTRLLEG